MDALSPVRTCDPWAVHSAKSFEKHSSGIRTLTPIQLMISSILKKTGGIEPPVLLRQLGGEMSLQEPEREFSVLRHMEKAHAEKRVDRIVWRLW